MGKLASVRAATARPGSWVLVDRATGAAILETWSKRVADSARRANRVDVVPILTWLQWLNRREAHADDKCGAHRCANGEHCSCLAWAREREVL